MKSAGCGQIFLKNWSDMPSAEFDWLSPNHKLCKSYCTDMCDHDLLRCAVEIQITVQLQIMQAYIYL